METCEDSHILGRIPKRLRAKVIHWKEVEDRSTAATLVTGLRKTLGTWPGVGRRMLCALAVTMILSGIHYTAWRGMAG